MAAAGQQQHGFAGRGGLQDAARHGQVARDLHACHRSDLALGQRVAVPQPDGLLLRLESSNSKPRIERRIGHRFAQPRQRQVAAQHRHTGTNRGHHRGPIGWPGPGLVAPLQGLPHCGFIGAG